ALSGAARTALAERGRSAGSSARRDPSALAQGATNVGRAQRRGADFTRGEGRSAGPSGPRGTRAQRNRGVPLGELRCPLGGVPELGPVEAGIDAALPEQLLVPSLLDDAAVLQDQDHIRLLHGRQSVRDDQRGPSLRSEEHTSELQSRENIVCRLLLEKKKLL